MNFHRYDKARQALFSVHCSKEVVDEEMLSIKAACEEDERQAQVS